MRTQERERKQSEKRKREMQANTHVESKKVRDAALDGEVKVKVVSSLPSQVSLG